MPRTEHETLRLRLEHELQGAQLALYDFIQHKETSAMERTIARKQGATLKGIIKAIENMD